jgi:phage portal protein BeeE
MNKHIYFDGRKSIELSQYPDEAWTWLTGEPDDGKTGIKEYFKAVPWLFRGVSLRANAVSKMPFEIYKGDGEDAIDASDKYENVVKFMPNPMRTLRLIEMSLALMGVAYLFNVRNQVVTLDLKYLNPTTIEPIIDESSSAR